MDNQNALWAGGIAGIVGMFAFLIMHHLTIKPIWFILPVGSLLALAGGAAVGWAYQLLLPRLPQNIWVSALILAAALTLTQVPGFLIGHFLREPILDMTTATILPGKGWEAAGRFALDLILTAGIAGAILGWWIGGSSQSALRLAIAGFAFSVGPGHNIPFFAGTDGAAKMWAIMVAVIVTSAMAFAIANIWLER